MYQIRFQDGSKSKIFYEDEAEAMSKQYDFPASVIKKGCEHKLIEDADTDDERVVGWVVDVDNY